MLVKPFAVLLTLALVRQQSRLCSGRSWRSVGTGSRFYFPADISRQATASSNCEEGNVFFARNCYPEFTRGHPCPNDQWLVKSTSDTSRVTGVCQMWPCPRGQYLWTTSRGLRPAQVCHSKESGVLTCPLHETGFVSRKDRTGKCDCKDGNVYWKAEDRCYPLFSRGPCAAGEILYYDPVEDFLACQTNPCERENFVLWTDDECYELNKTLNNPCPDPDITVLLINATSLEVQCSYTDFDDRSIIRVPPKRNCQATKEPGTTLSRCAEDSDGLEFRNDVVSTARGCETGYIRTRDGSCSKWKFRRSKSKREPSQPSFAELTTTSAAEVAPRHQATDEVAAGPRWKTVVPHFCTS